MAIKKLVSGHFKDKKKEARDSETSAKQSTGVMRDEPKQVYNPITKEFY